VYFSDLEVSNFKSLSISLLIDRNGDLVKKNPLISFLNRHPNIVILYSESLASQR
jgi:hypothetical protein